MTRLTFLKAAVLDPVWAPDGKHLVFSILSHDLSGPGVYWIRADGAGEPQRLLDGPYLPGSFSPDGKILAYSTSASTTTEYGIWMLPLDLADPEHPKPGKPEMFLASKSPWSPPSFSPDGKWLAYDSAETRPRHIFVRPFSSTLHAGGGHWQISSSDGGTPPVRWIRDGNEISYLGLDGRFYVVSYTANGASFIATQPRLWSQKLEISAVGAPVMMPDGKHLIVVTSPEAAALQTHVRFLLNFPDELQRHTRAGR
jgi:eukaryotic-like serine/threonine-protein kinase